MYSLIQVSLYTPTTGDARTHVMHTFRSTLHFQTTVSHSIMDQITQALAHLNTHDDANISEVARQYGVERSTLSRRYNGVTKTAHQKAENQMLLNHQQE